MTGVAGEHALPLDPGRILELLREEDALPGGSGRAFERVAHAIEALFHQEFLVVRRRLKRAWDALEPEGTRQGTEAGDVRGREATVDLLGTLRRLLHRANFTEIPAAEISSALKSRSIFAVGVDIDLGDFEQLAAWRRAESVRRETVATWFGWRRRTLSVPTFDRFCVFARFKGADHFAASRATRHKLGVVPGGVSLQLFRDVPRNDIEVLFPGVQVRMQLFDRAIIGLPAAVGAVHLLAVNFSLKVLGTAGLALLFFLGLRKEGIDWREATAAFVTVGLLFLFAGRQWGRFLGKKNALHRQLAEHLHARMLDTGEGVFLHLVDEASEEEAAEAILAYAFLLRAGQPLALADLDAQIEKWILERTGRAVDFEEDDALRKLERLELVRREEDGRLSAVPLEAGLEQLKRRWGDLLEGRSSVT
jgi:hypothetical protein